MATRRKRKRTRRRKSRGGKRTRRTKRKRLRKKMRRKSRGGKRRRKQKGGFCAGPTSCMTTTGFRTSTKCIKCIGKHWVTEINNSTDMVSLGLSRQFPGKNELFKYYKKYTGRSFKCTGYDQTGDCYFLPGNRKLARLIINEIVKRMLLDPDSAFATTWNKGFGGAGGTGEDGWLTFLGHPSPILQLQSDRFYTSAGLAGGTRVKNTAAHNLLRDIHETLLLLQKLNTEKENYYENCAIADWIMQEKPEILIQLYEGIGGEDKKYNWNNGKGQDIYKITETYIQEEIEQLKLLYKRIHKIKGGPYDEIKVPPPKPFVINEINQSFNESEKKSKYLEENKENMGENPLPYKE